MPKKSKAKTNKAKNVNGKNVIKKVKKANKAIGGMVAKAKTKKRSA